MENIPDAWEDLETSQRSQFINVLDRSGYNSDYIGLYLQTGMLPRNIRVTYTNYVGLLNTVNSHASGIPEESWSCSLAGKMLALHCDQLTSINSRAAQLFSVFLRLISIL
jgi:hypothetical protein